MQILWTIEVSLFQRSGRPPTPVAAAVELAPGMGVDVDQRAIKELVAAFNEVDLDALMTFDARRNNYHGLKKSDVHPTTLSLRGVLKEFVDAMDGDAWSINEMRKARRG